MLDSPPPSEMDPDDVREARFARYGVALEELVEIGMDLARELRRQVLEPVEDDPGRGTPARIAEVSLSFSRIAKAVRMTVALDKKLHEAPASVSTGSAAAIEQRVRAELYEREAAEAPVIARDIGRKLWRMAGKPMIRYAIELAIETEHEGEERERLLAELDARLEAEDSEEQRLYGPGQYQELLQRICQDLGLAAVRLGRDFYWNQPAYAPVDADDLAAGP